MSDTQAPPFLSAELNWAVEDIVYRHGRTKYNHDSRGPRAYGRDPAGGANCFDYARAIGYDLTRRGLNPESSRVVHVLERWKQSFHLLAGVCEVPSGRATLFDISPQQRGVWHLTFDEHLVPAIDATPKGRGFLAASTYTRTQLRADPMRVYSLTDDHHTERLVRVFPYFGEAAGKVAELHKRIDYPSLDEVEDSITPLMSEAHL